jgi:hypothetical protein
MQFTTKRENFADRGINRLSNSYSNEEFLVINRYLLQSSDRNQNIAQYLYIRLDIILGHYFVLRGESRKMGELADF